MMICPVCTESSSPSTLSVNDHGLDVINHFMAALWRQIYRLKLGGGGSNYDYQAY